MKIGIGLAAGVAIVVAGVIMVLAWIKGGVQPAHVVEVPVAAPAGGA